MIAEDPNNHGAMCCDLIFASDKTTVSVATGQNEYWPLYMSLGNVWNNVRRAHRNAIVVIGFLAIPKGDVVEDITLCTSLMCYCGQWKKPTQRMLHFASFAASSFTQLLLPSSARCDRL